MQVDGQFGESPAVVRAPAFRVVVDAISLSIVSDLGATGKTCQVS